MTVESLDRPASGFRVSDDTLSSLSASLAQVRATVRTNTTSGTRVRQDTPADVTVSLRQAAGDAGELPIDDGAEAQQDVAARALGALPLAASIASGDEAGALGDLTGSLAENEHVSPDEQEDTAETSPRDIEGRLPTHFQAWPERSPKQDSEQQHDDLFGDIVDATEEFPVSGAETENDEDDEAIEEPVTLATEGLDAETKRGLYKHAQQEITSLLDRLNNASYSGKGAKTALYAIFREFELTRQDYLDLIHGVDTRRTVDAIHQVFDESGLNEWVEAAEEAVHTMLGISVYEFAGAGLLVTEDVKLSIRDVAYRLANYMGALLRKQMKQTEQDADEAEDTDAIPEGHRVIAGHHVAQIGTQLRESTQRAWAQARGWFSGLQLRERLNDLLDSGAAAQDPQTMRQIQQAQVRIPGQTARTPAAQPQPASQQQSGKQSSQANYRSRAVHTDVSELSAAQLKTLTAAQFREIGVDLAQLPDETHERLEREAARTLVAERERLKNEPFTGN